MKILITGASGFVGMNLCSNLKKTEHTIIGTVHNKPIDGIINIKCDCTQLEDIKKAVSGCDQVFMLATKTYGAGIMKSNPTSLITDNIIMNANTLQACFEMKVKKVLVLSSATVYQESYKPLAEEDLDLNLPPYSLYEGVGWVKRYTEQLCNFYAHQGLNVVVVRPTNLYGPQDKYEEGSHFIPAIIKRMLEKQNPLVIWGKGNSIKNLIYIDDFIRDILKVMKYHNSPDPINLCGDYLYSVRDIVKEICKYGDKTIPIIYDDSKPDAVPFRGILRNKFDSLYGKESYTTLQF
jgi:GDP-L-fucose synthase